jgi:hypothetical protein
METKRTLSVLIGCYGDYPHYSLRAVKSVLSEQRDFDIHIGCNSCSPKTVSALRNFKDDGKIDTLVESSFNINKDPMMRVLLEFVKTEYVLWMDDDSHFTGPWYSELLKFVNHKPFDCAGHVFFCHKSNEYKEFLKSRPWFKDDESFSDPTHKDIVWFATGGCFLVRTSLLTENGFPDQAMVKKQDDLLLGDLISQKKGRLVQFPQTLMDVVRISDGDRRGTGESSDGWRHFKAKIGDDSLKPSINFKDIWQLAERVHGWFTKSEAETLFEFSSRMPTNLSIIEIGAYRGRTTCILAATKRSIVSINDLESKYFYGTAIRIESADILEFKGIVKRNDNILWKVSTDDLSEISDASVGLLLIDGNHDYPNPLNDFIKLEKKLSRGSIVCFHDYDVFDGVNKAIACLENQGKLRLLEIRGSLYVGQYQFDAKAQLDLAPTRINNTRDVHLASGTFSNSNQKKQSDNHVTGLNLIALCHKFSNRARSFSHSLSKSEKVPIPIILTIFYCDNDDKDKIEEGLSSGHLKVETHFIQVKEERIMQRALHFNSWNPPKGVSHCVYLDVDLWFPTFFWSDYICMVAKEKRGYWSAKVRNISFEKSEELLKNWRKLDESTLKMHATTLRHNAWQGRVGHFQCIPTGMLRYPPDPIKAVNQADDTFAQQALALSLDKRRERRIGSYELFHFDHPHSWEGAPIPL